MMDNRDSAEDFPSEFLKQLVAIQDPAQKKVFWGLLATYGTFNQPGQVDMIAAIRAKLKADAEEAREEPHGA